MDNHSTVCTADAVQDSAPTSDDNNNNNSSPRKNRRPGSLSLTVAGEWLQQRVKKLGRGGPLNGKRAATVLAVVAGPVALTRPAMGDHTSELPAPVQEGTWMTKVSGKKQKKVLLRLDADMGHIVWESKQARLIPVENIKEIRSGPSTRLHRHHFQLAQDYETLWLTIIYILDGHYKILHLIAPSEDIFRMWDTTLRNLHAYRLHLLTGLGNIEERQRVWEKQYWRGGGGGGTSDASSSSLQRDQKLTFEDVEKLCRRLNINSPRTDLLGWFKQADLQARRYLDFEDFRRFVRLLKSREEITRLFNSLKGHSELFDFKVFVRFMREEQKSTLSTPALLALFDKYAVTLAPSPPPPPPSLSPPPPPPLPLISSTSSPPSTPHPSRNNSYFDSVPLFSTPATSSSSPPPAAPPQRLFTPDTLTTFLLSPDNAPFASPSHSSLPPTTKSSSSPSDPVTTTTTTTISAKHDMTHPLSSYYISSSHNTYLVGHQFVGSSTVEGYIRALLAGCRSVEIDIYDGSGGGGSESTLGSLGSSGSEENTNEPMVFHGHTLTSKVPLRQVCQAIMKYGFIASPYPIIISAENHCSVQGQEMIARIMIEEFGTALVRYPTDGPDLPAAEVAAGPVAKEGNWKGKARIDKLPSPEELKGRILLKTKNLMLGRDDSGGMDSDTDPSSSASESEFMFSAVSLGRIGRSGTHRHGQQQEIKKKDSGGGKMQRMDSGDIVREGLIKASSVLQRVRSVGRTSSSPQVQQQQPINVSTTSPPGLSSPLMTTSPASLSPAPPATTPIPIARALPPPSSYPTSSPSPKIKSPVSAMSGLLSRRSSDATTTSALSDWESGGGALSLVRRKSQASQKPKMAMALLALLVYTVGVKCHGFRRKASLPFAPGNVGGVNSSASSLTKEGGGVAGEEATPSGVVIAEEEELYAPEHMFSLSENSANKMLRTGMLDLIRHTEGHLVRVYPRGTRMRSTNFVPHRYWSAGAQLVAINWQTFDLGYIINHAMFQRNARCGYVLKPPPLRHPSAPEYSLEKWRKTSRVLSVVVISAQQLPRVKVKDGSGHEVDVSERRDEQREAAVGVKEGGGGGAAMAKDLGGGPLREGFFREGKGSGNVSVDPYVEVSLHIPEWTYCTSPALPVSPSTATPTATATAAAAATTTPVNMEPLRFTTSQPKTITHRTQVVKNNGFNPVWNQNLRIPFDCVSMPGMLELIFVRFVVRQEGLKEDAEPLAVCCVSLGELQQGYRHLPLYDAQLSQYLFSTLFVKINVM